MAYSAESFGRLARLARKELSEILRDRRTIVTLFLMPLLLYPVLSIAFQQFYVASQADPTKAPEYLLGFVSAADETALMHTLDNGLKELDRRRPLKQGDPARPKLFVLEKPLDKGEVEAALRDNKVHLVLTVKEFAQSQARSDAVADVEALFVPQSAASIGALQYAERLLAAANGAALEKRLLSQPKGAVIYVRQTRVAVAAAEDNSLSLAALVPLILILMTITGAVYPAIDLTAGERERGTLEILVAAPVPRLGLLFAKYVTVMTVAMLTAVVNLVTMIITLTFSGLGKMPQLQGALTAGTLVELLFLLLLFAMFFSAVLLCLTSFARSFKEAQAYLIPLMLASLGPGLLGLVPGMKLEGFLMVAPLVNIVLLARDLLQSQAELWPAALVVISTLVYAAGAIAVAARVFGAESVLYSEQSSWSDLFRRPREASDVPTPAVALWCLLLTIPTHFILQGSVGLLGPLPRAVTFLLVAGVSVLLFGGLPALFAWVGRLRWRPAFGLLPARPQALAGGLVLGLSLWPLVLWLISLVHSQPPEWLQQKLEPFLQALRRDRQEMMPLVVLSVVLPALLEELFFRGFLFSALRKVSGSWTTILSTALAFGVLHVVMEGPLGLSRFLPSTLMGLVLGWVCWTSGSVVPGMILHAVHNALLMVVAPDYLGLTDEVTAGWLLAGMGGTVVGLLLVRLGRKDLPASPAV